MELEKKDQTWIQCQHCGYIYAVPYNISVEALFIKVRCPKCYHNKGLNCGDKREDIWMYANPNVDFN